MKKDCYKYNGFQSAKKGLSHQKQLFLFPQAVSQQKKSKRKK